jgi:hypothetical protein
MKAMKEICTRSIVHNMSVLFQRSVLFRAASSTRLHTGITSSPESFVSAQDEVSTGYSGEHKYN